MLIKGLFRMPCAILGKKLTVVFLLCILILTFLKISTRFGSLKSALFFNVMITSDYPKEEGVGTDEYASSTASSTHDHYIQKGDYSTLATEITVTSGSEKNLNKGNDSAEIKAEVRNESSYSFPSFPMYRGNDTLHKDTIYINNRQLSLNNTYLTPVDLMTEGPFEFLPNYKNPCWIPATRNVSDPPVQCLPYFFLIGAPKAGTTDFFRRLQQHPEVSKFLTKEPHWISRKHYYKTNRTRSDLSQYLKYFKKASREIFITEDEPGYHRTIIGDFSASTMWDNDYWVNLPQNANLREPKYTNADYIHHLNPNTRILAILRNPVNRLYSDYLFFHVNGTPKSFHEHSVRILTDFHTCMKNNTLRQCVYKPQRLYSKSAVRLRIGVYHVHLKEFFRVFPRDHIMVLKLEHLSTDTASCLQRVFSFLELTPVNKTKLEEMADPTKHANTRRQNDQKVGDMLPETRTLLELFYHLHNEALVDLLGNDFNYNLR